MTAACCVDWGVFEEKEDVRMGAWGGPALGELVFMEFLLEDEGGDVGEGFGEGVEEDWR